MVYKMKLNNYPFHKIATGKKTVELRLFDEKRRQLDIGDKIIFTNTSDDSEELAVRIKALYRYSTFEELFSEISPIKCGSSIEETIEEATARMNDFYSDEQIRYYGVLGIKIELVSLEDVKEELEQIKEAECDKLFPDNIK